MMELGSMPGKVSERVLIVDDSPTQAEYLRYILEKNHYQVTVAPDGDTALAMIVDVKPALIITDIIMPVMDGYELCRRIKANYEWCNIRIILLTTLSDPRDIIRGLACGADNFTSKPYGEEDLISRINYLLLNRYQQVECAAQPDLRVVFAEQEYAITSGRRQILDLLLSTYETVIRKNNELIMAQNKLEEMNLKLELAVEQAMQAKQRAEAAVDKLYLKESAMQQWNMELRLVHDIEMLINHAGDIRDLFTHVCGKLASTEVFGCGGEAMVCLLGEDGITSCFDAVAGKLTESCCIVPREFLCGLGFQNGRISPHIEMMRGEWSTTCRDRQKRIIIPLIAKEKPIGILSVASISGNELDERQTELLESLGHQLGMAVDNMRLFEETRTFALHDPLTGLSNRRSLEIHSEICLARNKRSATPFSVLILDIDHFKRYNDTHGHAAGDRILMRTADILKQNLRHSNLAVRFGGEEFLLLLSDTVLQGAIKFAERLRNAIEHEAGITVSIGVAQYQGEEPFESVVKAADEALYTAKRNGRNRVEFFPLTVQSPCPAATLIHQNIGKSAPAYGGGKQAPYAAQHTAGKEL
jgi:diguanylate cyclase (GGDEF)-like protein